MFEIQYTKEAFINLKDIKSKNLKKLNKIKSAIDKLANDPRHPGLHTHKYQSLKGPSGEDVWQSYAENKTAGAFRIFWVYGPDKEDITITAVTPHP